MNPPADDYGNAWADVYDDVHSFDAAAAVDTLAKLARSGRALELGVGTGRVAIPLAAAGVEVHGIDASPAMVARLRGKPGGDRVEVTIADFTTVPVEGEFALVYVVFNTMFALLSPAAQQTCFAHVARRLAPGGVFVVEAFVPDPSLYDRGQRVNVDHIAPGRVHLSVAKYDPSTQRITAQNIVITEAGNQLRPVDLRISYPTELDLMAQLAGLGLRERWSNWSGGPFTAGSTKHISIYEAV